MEATLRFWLFVAMVALLAFVAGGVYGSYVREQIIIQQCNDKGEYEGLNDAYIYCERED